MVVGVGQVLLRLPGNHSLKGKRRILRQIVERIKQRFNISIAEVDAQDQWQLIYLGISQVGLNGDRIRTELDKVLNFIEKMNLVEIIDVELEIIHFSTKDILHEKLSPCL
ncbi:MAG TPA: DUF503 domain-containing protein [Candidatus Desulfofervidus auxilii]|uniref:DUF503 domain-containing protein n=1 Tax=Desulfofervidus auxilii TaxID=1621989 RepID=A0A7C0U2W0_DESA2|nr:DUF503 domain-containing protein [Candidatus Desulfofervidus auxilii]HDD44524.1 DUF503 domain-containing protein [Candidatus Desulfofervidus auxilii]